MIKPITTINVYYSTVTIERRGVRTSRYQGITDTSLARLHRAVSHLANKQYAPRITLFSGGYEIEF